MADLSSTAHLYLSVTQLGYAETQLAINPRPPFTIADRSLLLTQGTTVADCAARLRQKDGNSLAQQSVFESQKKVDAAMSMFYVIQSQPSNSYTKKQIEESVDAATAKVDAL